MLEAGDRIMSEPNTLFIIAKMGVKPIDKSGVFESHMWLLNACEGSMKYVSLHRSKNDPAYIGGKITRVRLATNGDIEEHQDCMVENGRERMNRTDGRKVVVFSREPKWKASWPDLPEPNRRMYKRAGYVAWNNAGDS